MSLAIEEARQSLKEGNRGYGAVIVKQDGVISRAHDTMNTNMDITGHAEVNALRSAVNTLGTKNLEGCTLFATHDPCAMCGSVIVWARISKVVIGLTNEKSQEEHAGIHTPVERLAERSPLPIEVIRGVLMEECRKLPTIHTR